MDYGILSKIDDLQGSYVAALDKKDMAAWLNTFSANDEASYVCLSAENEEAGMQMALIMDDNRARLLDRVDFVTKVWVGTFPDYRTRHVVQRTSCHLTEPGVYHVQSNFSVTYVPSDTGRVGILSCGIYVDAVQVGEDGARFLSKRVITDASVLERYLVFPL